MRKICIILYFSLILFPAVVCAKTASLTVVTNAIEEAEKEIEKFQDDLEVVTNTKMMINSAREKLNKIKEEAIKEAQAYAMSEAQRAIAKNKTFAGIADKMNFGDFVTADAREAYRDKYVFKSDVKKDVEERAAYDEKMNELLINNVSAMYARALIKRYNLQKESQELAEREKKEDKIDDESQMINAIKNVKMEANRRWINILISMAGHQNNEASIKMGTLTQLSDPFEEKSKDDKTE